MSSRPLQRTMSVTIISLIVAVAGLAYFWLSIGPSLKTSRTAIDDRRASILVAQQEQTNLQSLSRDIENLKTQQSDLQKHIWSFAEEDSFFTLWSDLAAAQHVQIDQPNVADVTPSNHPLNREVTIQVSGLLNNVLDAVGAIQKIEPLVVVKNITLKSGTANGVVNAAIEAQTLWQ